MLYLFKLTVEFRIKQEDVACLKGILCRQDCSCTAFAAQQTLDWKHVLFSDWGPDCQSGRGEALCQWHHSPHGQAQTLAPLTPLAPLIPLAPPVQHDSVSWQAARTTQALCESRRAIGGNRSSVYLELD